MQAFGSFKSKMLGTRYNNALGFTRMIIHGTISFSDYLAAQWLHIRPRRWLAIVGVVLLVLVIWALWWTFIRSNHHRHDSGDWVFLAAIAYLMLLPLIVWYKSRRTYRQRRDLHRPLSFSVLDAGLETQTEHSHGMKPWSDYHRWKEGKAIFLLYISDNFFQLIPKHLFANDADIASFRAILQAKIK